MLLFIFKLLSFLCVLVGVAFYTLVERKFIRYAQLRVGPNKVRIAGIFQPFSDALKLLSKDLFFPSSSNWRIFILRPSLSLILALAIYLIVLDFKFTGLTQPLILWILLILSLGVFPSTLAGWSRNRSYARVGGYRRLRQTIRYEVALFLRLFIPLRSYERLRIEGIKYPIRLFLGVLLVLFLVVVLAETNRAPFDLSEGERELVSGFNIEYGGAGFTLFFLAEYAIILCLSLWIRILFFSNLFFGFIFIFLILIIRASYPRLRYDSLIRFIWRSYLPIITFICSLFLLFI